MLKKRELIEHEISLRIGDIEKLEAEVLRLKASLSEGELTDEQRAQLDRVCEDCG